MEQASSQPIGQFDAAQFPSITDYFVEDDDETETCRQMGGDAHA